MESEMIQGLTRNQSVPSAPSDLVEREVGIEREKVDLRVFSLRRGDL